MMPQRDPNACPVCGLDSVSQRQSARFDRIEFACANCGRFALTDTAHRTLDRMLLDVEFGPERLAYAIRLRQKLTGETPVLGTSDVERILAGTKLPSVTDQVSNLLRLVAEEAGSPGARAQIPWREISARVGAPSVHAVGALSEHLERQEWIRKVGDSNCLAGSVTIPGWVEYERILRGQEATRRAFMAMPFGKPGLDRMFFDAFKPAAAAAGFDLERLDENPRAGLIDDRLRVEIRTARFLVVELTENNAGAYWEGGFAEGLEKPVIYTCRQDWFDRTGPHEGGPGVHFDANHRLMVLWRDEDLETARQRLTATIRATLPAEAKMTDDAADDLGRDHLSCR